MRRGAKPAKAKVVAKLPVVGKSLKNERSRVRRLQKRLEEVLKREAETLAQQTATGNILRVISSSPSDLRPVMDAVAESAARLCEADAVICQRDGDFFVRVAKFGPTPTRPLDERAPLTRQSAIGRAIIDGRTVEVPDLQTARDEFPDGFDQVAGFGIRTMLATPLMREGVAIGWIQLRRTEARLFTERQVALLQTFADQAVIAIENVRLFKELAARNRDLTEALEQQTATAEILHVISRSQTDTQPVFDTIVRSAVRLCKGLFSALYQFDGDLHYLVAQHNYTPEALEEVQRVFPARPTRALFTGRAILERAVVHIPNVELDPEFEHLPLSRAIGFRQRPLRPDVARGCSHRRHRSGACRDRAILRQ